MQIICKKEIISKFGIICMHKKVGRLYDVARSVSCFSPAHRGLRANWLWPDLPFPLSREMH